MVETIYSNPESRVPAIWSCVITVTVISLIAIVLRFYSRLKRKGLGADDWLCFVAAVLSLADSLILLLQIPNGFGRHIRDLPPSVNPWLAARGFWAGEFIYLVALGILKISILTFYFRIIPWLRVHIWVLIIYVILSSFALTIASIFQCTPVSYVWSMTTEKGHCIHMKAFWYASGAINTLSDIVIFMLPMPSLWSMQVGKMQRCGILAVFGVGLFVVVTGFLRLNALKKSDDLSDPTWTHESCGLWSLVELHVGVVCACMPSMKPLLTGWFGWVSSRSSSPKTSNLSSKMVKSDKGPHVRKKREDTLDMIMKTENADLEAGGLWTMDRDTSMEKDITLEKIDSNAKSEGGSPRRSVSRNEQESG